MSLSISDGAARTTAYVSPRAVAGGSWSAVVSGAMYAEKDAGLFVPSVHERKRAPPLGTVSFTCGEGSGRRGEQEGAATRHSQLHPRPLEAI